MDERSGMDVADAFRLETLDFIESREFEDRDPSKIPIPSEPPHITGRGQIPLELQRSAALEALIAQNEDLMARLKVNLRRITQNENEIDELRRENRRLADTNGAIKDQSAIFSEKETAWSTKLKSLEEQMEILQKKAQQNLSLQEKVERYKKYQERIKTQVKPFVQQLKSYADSLNAEVQKLYSEIGEKDHEIDRLNSSKARLDEQLHEILSRSEKQQTAIIDQFEKERETLTHELVEFRARCHALEADARKIDQMRTRETELENLVVALKRDKEFDFKQHQDSEQDLKNQLGQIRSHAKFQESKIEDLERQKQSLQDENERATHQNAQIQEQIASLRYMWSSQSQELEKTKLALAALEKLNVELSRKLNNSRTTSQSSEPIAEPSSSHLATAQRPLEW